MLGPETFFRGTLRGKDNYLVCGQAEADADLDGLFVLALGGRWRGSITAAHIVIAGEVRGNVTARVKLEIAASARILGICAAPDRLWPKARVCDRGRHAIHGQAHAHDLL